MAEETKKPENSEKTEKKAYEMPDILKNLNINDYSSRVADILSDLNAEAIPDITDRLEKVDLIITDLDTLSGAVVELVDAYNAQSEELLKQKEANTRLLYDRVHRDEANAKQEEEKISDVINDAVENIDIYEDED